MKVIITINDIESIDVLNLQAIIDEASEYIAMSIPIYDVFYEEDDSE